MSPKAGPIEHGSDRGYQAHLRRREIACEECKEAHREWARTHRGPAKLKPIEHGTERGYQAELRRNLETCPKCRAAHNVYYELKKARKAIRTRKEVEGGRRQPIKHGTPTGYAAHRRRKEEACDPCRKAHSQKMRDDKLRRAGGQLGMGRGKNQRWARVSVEVFAQMYWTATPETQDLLDAELGREKVDRIIRFAEMKESA